MSTLSSADQQVWKKVLAAKNQSMTQAQIEQSFPGVGKKGIQSSIVLLLRLQLLSTASGKDGTVFHAQQPSDAKKKQALTPEQSLVLGLVGQAGNRGISAKSLRGHIGSETMPATQLRKTLETLEKNGQIVSFKGIQQPTLALYILANVKPAEDLAGGVWYDMQKEYDAQFVDTICKFLLLRVQNMTFPAEQKRTPEQIALIPNPIYPITRTSKLPTPFYLLDQLKKSKITLAVLTVKNVMECMRALELDGLVEAIKPVGGVDVPEDPGMGSDDEAGPATKRQKKATSDDDEMDEDERERREMMEREKAKAKAKEKRRREKEKDKERRRKERERKRKEKEREKRRKKKEKERRKKKRKQQSSDADDSDDSDALVDINDLVKSRSQSQSKSKRNRHASSSLSESSASSSASSSDPDSDSDDSSSSVDSDELDSHAVPFRPKSTAAAMDAALDLQSLAFSRTDLTNLDDTHVVYRATNRLGISLGQTQAPCGKCPQFNFCEERGPVNAESCSYLGDWLAELVGGWDSEGRKRYRPTKGEVDLEDVVMQAAEEETDGEEED